jgi:hypothetical protein
MFEWFGHPLHLAYRPKSQAFYEFWSSIVNTSGVCSVKTEGDYFHDEMRNNRISCFKRAGHDEKANLFRGAKDPAEVWKNKTHFCDQDAIISSDWAEFITNHIGRMDPKPDYLLLNAGLWGHRFGEPEVRQGLVDAAKEVGIKTFWRTTTKRMHGTRGLPVIESDRRMCKLLDGCINISFSDFTHPDHYDTRRLGQDHPGAAHFREPVSRIMNEMILDGLGYLQPGYKRLDPNIVSLPYDAEVETNSSLAQAQILYASNWVEENLFKKDGRCGCASCTDAVLNRDAGGVVIGLSCQNSTK